MTLAQILLLLAFCPLAVLTATGEVPRTPESDVRRLVTGFRFVEGPAWNPATRTLVFSDIPADTIYTWSPESPTEVAVFRSPSGKANGNLFLPDGSLLTCQHAERRVLRTKPDGTTEVLTASFDGAPLNSPNDVAWKSDGTIWFTDPAYGLEGRPEEQSARAVYRLDPDGSLTRVATGFDQPNGLCFSPDEKLLYIADSGKPSHVRVFPVNPDNSLGSDRVFVSIKPGVPDGMRCDARGRLFVAAGDGVQVFDPSGAKVHLIPVPEAAANLCFGGDDLSTVFITARKSLYAAPLPP